MLPFLECVESQVRKRLRKPAESVVVNMLFRKSGGVSALNKALGGIPVQQLEEIECVVTWRKQAQWYSPGT